MHIIGICNVWEPPQIEVPKRNGLYKEKIVYIAVNDGRLPSKKIKTNTISENVVQSFITVIQSAYPNVKFAIKDNYFEKDTIRMPLINLTILAYQAGFGTEVSTGIGVIGGNVGVALFPQGKWNAITALYCEVVDEEKKVSKDIHNVSSRDNIWGYKSSRQALEDSFRLSVQQMLVFLDNNL